jgi:hypothetical protein
MIGVSLNFLDSTQLSRLLYVQATCQEEWGLTYSFEVYASTRETSSDNVCQIRVTQSRIAKNYHPVYVPSLHFSIDVVEQRFGLLPGFTLSARL